MPSQYTYFPKGAFADGFEESDDFHQEWYGAHLDAMKEPRLYDLTDSNLAVYRFLCLPTFERPFAIRISSRPERMQLALKSTNGSGGYGPGLLVMDGMLKLTNREYRGFQRLVAEADFWLLSSTQSNLGGYDGTQCIVEGYAESRYHVVDRWTPSGTPFSTLCKSFVALLPWPLNTSLYAWDRSGRD